MELPGATHAAPLGLGADRDWRPGSQVAHADLAARFACGDGGSCPHSQRDLVKSQFILCAPTSRERRVTWEVSSEGDG